MDILETIANRFSMRSFATTPIEPEKLARLTKVVTQSPTARNKQPFHVYLATSEHALNTLAELSPCTFHAPVVAIICKEPALAATFAHDSSKDWSEVDSAILIDELALAACDLGLGTCIVGMFNPQEVSAAFDLPEGRIPLCLLPMGYPAKDAAPGPMHKTSRPLDEMVSTL